MRTLPDISSRHNPASTRSPRSPRRERRGVHVTRPFWRRDLIELLISNLQRPEMARIASFANVVTFLVLVDLCRSAGTWRPCWCQEDFSRGQPYSATLLMRKGPAPPSKGHRLTQGSWEDALSYDRGFHAQFPDISACSSEHT